LTTNRLLGDAIAETIN